MYRTCSNIQTHTRVARVLKIEKLMLQFMFEFSQALRKYVLLLLIMHHDKSMI